MGLVNGHMMFVNDRDHANYLPVAHYFVWAAAEAFSWAIITPFIFLFARQYPFQASRWLVRTGQYVALTAIVVTIQPILKAPAWLYKPDQHLPLLGTILDLGHKSLIGAIQVCLLLYLLSAYQNAKRQSRRLQLREAELKAQVSSAELHILRMQLHPHFLFNALQATTVLVHEDPASAEKLLQHLSELLRVALDDMRSLQVTLEQEITFLRHYVEIQKQRFQERLEVRFDIPAEALRIAVPTLLLQPLVENAIHHGIGRHKGTDSIEVAARREGRALVLEIRNFASTLDEAPTVMGHGVGLKNTRTRLEQMYGEHATVDLRSLVPRGVCARVILPAKPTEVALDPRCNR